MYVTSLIHLSDLTRSHVLSIVPFSMKNSLGMSLKYMRHDTVVYVYSCTRPHYRAFLHEK